MAETRVLTAERVSLGDTKTDRQRKAAITEQLADLKGNTDAIQLCIALEKECAHFRDRLLKQPKAMKAEHEAAKQQQQQQQQQRPHSSLNISGAGVRNNQNTPSAPLNSAKGGEQQQQQQHQQQRRQQVDEPKAKKTKKPEAGPWARPQERHLVPSGSIPSYASGCCLA